MSHPSFVGQLVALMFIFALPVAAQDAPPPHVTTDGVALVSPANTARDRFAGTVEVFLDPDPARDSLDIVDPASTSAEAGLLRRYFASGLASGLGGVVYDNRDSGHSVLRRGAFPQVLRSAYDDAYKTQNLHHGVAGRVLFSLPTIGNSSTALTHGPMARSLARLALGDQANAMRSYALYAGNHLYVYPEHRDYDPETGDRLYAPVPFFVVSQGSSYRDQPFVEALLWITAALRPDTRARLVDLGLLAPTVQMVLRRTLSGVQSDADYLTSRAHPVVFEPQRLRVAAAVSLANAIQPDAIPPMVALSVVSDLSARAGVDYLSENMGEVLFTTPTAVARLWRSYDYTRSMTVSAGQTQDPSGRDLEFHWVVLQGDPEKVRVTPRSDDPSIADIEIDWHDRFAVADGTGMQGSRVDIAVIADNGQYLSAPATISVLLPAFQNRVYAESSDGRFVLESLGYAPGTGRMDYADPAVWPQAPWRDRLSRNAEGRVTHIERTDLSTSRVDRLAAGGSGWHLDTASSGDTSTFRHRAIGGEGGALGLEMQPLRAGPSPQPQ